MTARKVLFLCTGNSAWPGQPMTAHWGVEDPAAVQGTDEDKRKAFLRAFAQLAARIHLLLSLPLEKLDRFSLEARVDEIGKTRGAE